MIPKAAGDKIVIWFPEHISTERFDKLPLDNGTKSIEDNMNLIY
tara:strand:- start:81 stop:212 length:132 start_codon:yes stop_codon:yes gene_type:complete